MLIIDPSKRSVEWLGLAGNAYQPLAASRLIALGVGELGELLAWPD